MPPKSAADKAEKDKKDAKKEEDLVMAVPLGKNHGNLMPVRTYGAVVGGMIAGIL